MTTTTKRKVKVRPRPSPSPEPAGFLRADCKICSAFAEFADVAQIGKWMARHFAREHPEQLAKLNEAAALFFTCILSDYYESEVWSGQQELVESRENLLAVLRGEKDLLEE